MRDLSRPLEECLQAVKQKRNLQEILRRYPTERDELIGMLRLSVDLSALGAPAADPAFRLRARNRMLGMAAQRRNRQRRNPLSWLPRPAARAAFAGLVAVAMLAAGVTAVAASNDSLPGDPLYGVKLTAERAQLAVTFDAAARARLQLHFADLRLEEAQQLFATGRQAEAVAVVSQYDADVTEFNQSVASSAFDDSAITDLSRLVTERQARADASLHALAGSLSARGDSQGAAIVAETQSRVDQSLKGTDRNLQSHQASGRAGSHQAQPAGAQH